MYNTLGIVSDMALAKRVKNLEEKVKYLEMNLKIQNEINEELLKLIKELNK